jgi:hypothetical protein
MVLLVSFNHDGLQVEEQNYNPLSLDFTHRKDIKPAKHFLQTYRNLFGNDTNESVSKYKYGRRKNLVLIKMSKEELLEDYSKDHELQANMTKPEIIKQLKKTDVRFWVNS